MSEFSLCRYTYTVIQSFLSATTTIFCRHVCSKHSVLYDLISCTEVGPQQQRGVLSCEHVMVAAWQVQALTFDLHVNMPGIT